jgi:hypothetical protein
MEFKEFFFNIEFLKRIFWYVWIAYLSKTSQNIIWFNKF